MVIVKCGKLGNPLEIRISIGKSPNQIVLQPAMWETSNSPEPGSAGIRLRSPLVHVGSMFNGLT